MGCLVIKKQQQKKKKKKNNNNHIAMPGYAPLAVCEPVTSMSKSSSSSHQDCAKMVGELNAAPKWRKRNMAVVGLSVCGSKVEFSHCYGS